MTRFISIFLAGLFALLPIVVTVTVVIWIGQFIYAFAGPNSQFGSIMISLGIGFTAYLAAAYFVGLLVAVAGIFILGFLVESGVRPLIVGSFEKLFARIPIISQIYDVSKRLIAIFAQDKSNELKSMQPVWCFFGGEKGAAVLALMPSSDPVLVDGEPYIGIMVPTAPVPFGGALIFVPQDWIRKADGGVEKLMNVYVSMGVVAPLAVKPREK